MSSETSSENNIKYIDTNGKKLINDKAEVKRQSTDTDFYFDMVANREKIVVKSSDHSESSDIIIESSSKNSESSSSESTKSSKSSKSSNKSNVETYNFEPKQKNEVPYNFATHQNNVPFTNMNIPIVNTKTLPPMEPTINLNTLNPQEIRIKKIELLRRLSEIKMKGYNLTKEYTFTSSIEEMEYEYGLLKSFADKRNGIKLYKSFLLNTVSLVEFANDKYDPFDFKLSGWSEHMSIEVDSWDDVLEELYEKYKTSGGTWPPELKLALLIIGSGAGYHFTKSQFSAVPSGLGAGSVLGKMMSNNQKQSQFMSPQEINLENQKKILKEKEATMKQKQKDLLKSNNMESKTNTPFNLNNLFNNANNTNNTNNINNTNNTNMNNQMPNIPAFMSKGNSRDIPEIRAPENVAEILSRIKNIQSQANINTTDTQEENSSNDRLLSDVTISTADPKKRGKKITKPIISINT